MNNSQKILKRCRRDKNTSGIEKFRQILDLSDENRSKMNQIIDELSQLEDKDIYKKSAITITKSYKRCAHDLCHKNELEKWQPKSHFTKLINKNNTYRSECNNCRRAAHAKKKMNL